MKGTLIAFGASLCAALLLIQPVVAAPAADDILVADPYARAVPAMMKNSAVFMTLRNTGDDDRAVVAAASPAAEVVELHTHIQDGDVMRMRKIDDIGISAGSTTVLEPGGLHIMLLGLKRALSPGDTVSVELTFADGSQKTLSAPVRSVSGMHQGHDQTHHHGHDMQGGGN